MPSMMKLMLLAALATTALALKLNSDANAQPGPGYVCGYGGSGSVTVYGQLAIDIADGRGTQYQTGLFASDAIALVSAMVINGSKTDDSTAGWIVSQNATGQSIWTWTQGKCSSSSVAFPQYILPGFSLCPGQSGSMFPTFAGSFNYTVNVTGYAFSNPQVGPAAGMTGSFVVSPVDGTQGGMVSLLSQNPLQPTNIFSFNAFGGVGTRPGPALITLPAICKDVF